MIIKKNLPLSGLISWKTQGQLPELWIAEREEDLVKIAEEEKEGKEFFLIGKGSNLLILDKKLENRFFKLGPEFANYAFEGENLRAGGAASLMALALKARDQSLSGLEFASSIPGSLAGAVIMNAGAFGSEMKDILKEITVFDKEKGEFLIFPLEEMDFSYRTSYLKNKSRYVVTEALLGLKPGKKEEILADMEEKKKFREENQPWDYPSAGSVFKNPPGDSAGRLIDQAGLKGFKIKDAQVSEKHANFILNLGQAQAEDILSLIEHIEKVVKEKYGIILEREILVLS